MNNSNNDSNGNQHLLSQKRKPQFSLEEILNIYCKQHNIEDNEIAEKIKTIYYHNPSQNILINYNKANGDKFPLSRHIIQRKYEEINLEEEKEKEKIEDIKSNNEHKDEEERKEKNDEILIECFICGWKFLKELSFEEKNRHINLCIEGKGEENKNELISTYKELENLKNNPEDDNNQNNNRNRNEEENEGIDQSH